MSSDLVRSIYTLAKQKNELEQTRAKEESAAVLTIATPDHGDGDNIYPRDEADTVYRIHKDLDSTVHLVREAQGQQFKFHDCNQAVGEYIAASFLTRREDALIRNEGGTLREAKDILRDVSISLSISRDSYQAQSCLHLRCTAKELPQNMNSILQAYASGSFRYPATEAAV